MRAIRTPRIIGLGTLSIAIIGGLHQNHATPWLYALVLIFGLAWPHIAYAWAIRSTAPVQAEYINLRLDSVFCGFWMVAMGFNLAPTILMITVLLMDNSMVGGLRLLGASLLGLAGGAAAAALLLGVRLCLYSDIPARFACLPFLVIYPVTIGVLSFRTTRKMHQDRARLHRLTQHDALSGLYSRTYWERRLGEEFQRLKRYKRSATLILLDIDNFKIINDSFGHATGDEAIRALGRVLDEQVRAGDIPARLGGDEFAILLPEATGTDARAVVQRVQAALAGAVFGAPGQRFSLTMSFGIAELAETAADPAAWMKCADAALYAAKRAGRNTLEIFRPEDPAPAPPSWLAAGRRVGD